MSERIAAGSRLNTSLRVSLADRLQSWLDPEGAQAGLRLWTKWFTEIWRAASRGYWGRTCPPLISECWSARWSPLSSYWDVWLGSRGLVWRGGWAPGCFVNMTGGITRKPSLRFRRAWNRAGFSCIPAHLPTCSPWWLQELRCTVSPLCLPVWWDVTAPQGRVHQSKSQRGSQSNCKRPSYINAAKVLCFIWTYLGLFVCTPHSFILGEIQSFSSHFKYQQYATCWCWVIKQLISIIKSYTLWFSAILANNGCFKNSIKLNLEKFFPCHVLAKLTWTVNAARWLTYPPMNHIHSVDVWGSRANKVANFWAYIYI